MVGRMTEVAKFRHDVHNIIDWGIFTNATKRIETMAKVKAKEAAQVLVPDDWGSPQKLQESTRKRDSLTSKAGEESTKESSIRNGRCDFPKQCPDQLRCSK